MTADQLMQKAINIAVTHHESQVDRDGHPHIFHAFRVAEKQETMERKIVAILHDVIEDSESPDIARSHICEEFQSWKVIIDAIEAITRGKDESWNSYYKRVRSNPTACWVKLADIEDNFSPKRCDLKISEKYPSYLEEYDKICNTLGVSRTLVFHPPIES